MHDMMSRAACSLEHLDRVFVDICSAEELQNGDSKWRFIYIPPTSTAHGQTEQSGIEYDDANHPDRAPTAATTTHAPHQFYLGATWCWLFACTGNVGSPVRLNRFAPAILLDSVVLQIV